MICDKCGKDTGGLKAKNREGEFLCESCLGLSTKGVPRKAVTEDPFIKLCRRYEKCPLAHQPAFSLFVESGSKRCYTNGAVLISNMVEVPEGATQIDLKSLKECDPILYPPIHRVIRDKPIKKGFVEIPEILYSLLKIFTKGRGSESIDVVMEDGVIHVVDDRDKTTMELSGVEMNLTHPLRLSIQRFIGLKAKRIGVDSSGTPMVSVESSYDSMVDSFEHVLIMGKSV